MEDYIHNRSVYTNDRTYCRVENFLCHPERTGKSNMPRLVLYVNVFISDVMYIIKRVRIPLIEHWIENNVFDYTQTLYLITHRHFDFGKYPRIKRHIIHRNRCLYRNYKTFMIDMSFKVHTFRLS